MAAQKTFGEFIYAKRLARGISLRKLADTIKVSAPYWSDVEKGRKNPPLAFDKLETIARELLLTDAEKEEMCELARKRNDGKAIVAPDVADYILNNDYLVAALREARDMDATKEDWESLIEDLRRRKG